MKTMTCKQLSGACNTKFQAKTFEQMAELSQKHGQEMYQKGDKEHIKVMKEMMKLMQDPKAMKKCMDTMRREFDASPENK